MDSTIREGQLLSTLKLIRKMYKMNPVMNRLIDEVIAGDPTYTDEFLALAPTEEEMAKLNNNERL